MKLDECERLALLFIALSWGAAGLWLWRRTGGDSVGGNHVRFGFVSRCFPLVLSIVITILLIVIVVFGVLKVLVPDYRYGRNSLGGRRCGRAKCGDDRSNRGLIVVFTDGCRERWCLVIRLVGWLVGLVIGWRR